MSREQDSIHALNHDGRMVARISSRSALANDFLMLMDRVPGFAPVDFRNAVLKDNALSRGSHSARLKLFKELKGRYILDDGSPLFAAFLGEWQRHSEPQERQLLAYTLFTLNDRTVYVTSCEWLFSRIREAGSELRVNDLLAFYRMLGKQGHPEIARWTQSTLTRVAQHYLASVRDFGLATGGIRKVVVRPSLKPAPIRLLVRALRLAGLADADVIRHPSFKIFGLAPSDVVDALGDLNRGGSLRFRMQADVIELTL